MISHDISGRIGAKRLTCQSVYLPVLKTMNLRGAYWINIEPPAKPRLDKCLRSRALSTESTIA